MLTPEQVAHFQTFGFLVFRQLFSADEVATLRAEFETGLTTAYAHEPFDGTNRHWTTMMGPETPFFAGLLEDPRLCETAEQLYGQDTLGIGCDANRYVGDTGWHPDTHSIHQYGVKFAFYLDPVGADSGALRVISGSHRDPFHSQLREMREDSQLDITGVPAYICASEPGDVVAFDLRLWHASWGGSKDRWMCTCVYYNDPKTAEEEKTTRQQAAGNVQTPAKFGRPNDPMYHPNWVANPSGNARRKRWIGRMRELGFFD